MDKFDTQKDFRDALEANGLRVTKAAVSHWELGRRFPTLNLLPIIAGVLGITIQQLLPDVDRRFDV